MATEPKFTPPRIYRLITCRTRILGRPGARLITESWIKVPYSGLFGLVDTLARAMTTGQLRWFKLQVALPRQITPEIRANLVRWDQALAMTTQITEARFDK